LILDLPDNPGKHVNHIVMASGTEKWFLQLDYVNMGKPAGYIQYLVSQIVSPMILLVAMW
jgi:hypothetical protein